MMMGLLQFATLIGNDNDALVAPLELVREISCSTNVIEQVHGQHSVLHRLHPEMSGKELCSRGLLNAT
eukprot:12083944-Karenia_brevis.AAC.1